ncbi:MAG: carboxyltransferase domain-containing protein [Sporomusaceae bacterium]|nr:carboxyltransferase domain-containing protein [Sporomusaceae bacterium]
MKLDAFTMIDYGDSAILVEFSKVFSEEAWKKAHYLAKRLEARRLRGITEVFPTYTTVLVVFNPLITDNHEIKAQVGDIAAAAAAPEDTPAQSCPHYRLPVLFGGEWGPELPFVASHLGISEQALIASFCDGFRKIITFATFCGFLMEGAPFKERIPRMTSPRTQVPGGYVAVAGNQTAVVPVTSPSGWQTIGHCPVRIIDLEAAPPVPYKPGDYIEFFPITAAEQALYAGKTIHEMRVMQ